MLLLVEVTGIPTYIAELANSITQGGDGLSDYL